MSIKLIVGLRNPGSAYEATRHNAGEWFIQALSQHYPCTLKAQTKFHGEVGQFSLKNHSIMVLLPLTFMNQSGIAVREVSQFYRIQPQEILVVHDELDLPPGRVKIKTDGGNGGHNGLRDIIAHLGQANFHRLRIGIGHPGQRDLVLNYVLGKPSLSDKKAIQERMEDIMPCIPELLTGNISIAMSSVNS